MATRAPREKKFNEKVVKVLLTGALIAAIILIITIWRELTVWWSLLFIGLYSFLFYWAWRAFNDNSSGPLFCPKCDKNISKNLVWRCAYCDTDNDNEKHALTDKCGTCFREPKSYSCQFCGHLIPLDFDNDMSRPAVCATESAKPRRIGEPDEQTKKTREHADHKISLEREIELAALSRQLIALKSSPEFKQELSEKEKIGKEYSTFEASVLGVKMLERAKRLENQQTLQDNPDLLEMKELAMDEFVQRQGMTPTRLVDKEKGTA